MRGLRWEIEGKKWGKMGEKRRKEGKIIGKRGGKVRTIGKMKEK